MNMPCSLHLSCSQRHYPKTCKEAVAPWCLLGWLECHWIPSPPLPIARIGLHMVIHNTSVFLLLHRHACWCHMRLCYAAFSPQLVQARIHQRSYTSAHADIRVKNANISWIILCGPIHVCLGCMSQTMLCVVWLASHKKQFIDCKVR